VSRVKHAPPQRELGHFRLVDERQLYPVLRVRPSPHVLAGVVASQPQLDGVVAVHVRGVRGHVLHVGHGRGEGREKKEKALHDRGIRPKLLKRGPLL